jgi:hypothetical protein
MIHNLLADARESLESFDSKDRSLWCAKLREHKKRWLGGGKIKFQGAGQSRTRRKKTESLSGEADTARLDPVGCQRCMARGRN